MSKIVVHPDGRVEFDNLKDAAAFHRERFGRPRVSRSVEPVRRSKGAGPPDPLKSSVGRLGVALGAIRDAGEVGVDPDDLATTLALKGPRGLSGLSMTFRTLDTEIDFATVARTAERGGKKVWVAGARILEGIAAVEAQKNGGG